MKKIDRMIEIMDGLIDQLGKQEDGLPLGWRCPVCGRGLAPHVSECSCLPTDTVHTDSTDVDILERMKSLGILRSPPPEA